MRKKFLAIAAAGLTLIGLQSVSANCCCMENWYTELAAGASWHRDSNLGNGAVVKEDTGYEINFSIGLKCECWRLALQAHYERYNNDNYQINSLSVNDNEHLQTFALFFNLFYDMQICDCLIWYLGAGAGAGMHRLDISNSLAGSAKNSSTKFAWQLMSGFVYDINPCWAVTLNYAWINLLKPNAPTGSTTASQNLRKAPYSNNIDLGLRLKF